MEGGKQAESGEETDPLGANGACYVCHMTFVKEDLAKVHLKEKISCAKCHGLSDKHANDEHVGATKPDVVYKRQQVDASCCKCHETHDVPAKKVIARFVEAQARHLVPNLHRLSRNAQDRACHGRARLRVESIPRSTVPSAITSFLWL